MTTGSFLFLISFLTLLIAAMQATWPVNYKGGLTKK